MPAYMQILVMKVIRNVCIGSEENREIISWESETIDPLIALIKRESPDAEFVREVSFIENSLHHRKQIRKP